MNRFTFVVQVHPEGICTLENLSTHERVRISDLETVGPQIERWLAEQSEPRPLPGPGSGTAPLESSPELGPSRRHRTR
jgi:hypothetical protein